MLVKALLIAVIALSLAGVIDSAYALRQHYANPGESGCNFNATINCDAVNQSKYSEIIGMPVAGIGLAGYCLFVGLSVWLLKRPNSFWVLALLVASSVVAFAYSLFLTLIEIFVLGAVCPMCIISMTLVSAILVLSIIAMLKNRVRETPA